MSIPSADSRSELCGTDTHRPRCVGCNLNLFLSVFELDLRLPFTPLWSTIRSFSYKTERFIKILVAVERRGDFLLIGKRRYFPLDLCQEKITDTNFVLPSNV